MKKFYLTKNLFIEKYKIFSPAEEEMRQECVESEEIKTKERKWKMRFRKNENEYDLTWRYDNVQSSFTGVGVVKTTCTLSLVDDTKTGKERFSPIMSASVVQDPRDNFSKSDGRRRSLTKLMKSWTNDKNDRKLVWANYFAQADFRLVSENDFEKNFGDLAHTIGI